MSPSSAQEPGRRPWVPPWAWWLGLLWAAAAAVGIVIASPAAWTEQTRALMHIAAFPAMAGLRLLGAPPAETGSLTGALGLLLGAPLGVLVMAGFHHAFRFVDWAFDWE